MPIIKTLQDHSFSAKEDETILAAATANQLNLPYSCRVGRCSSCKCKLVSGETIANSAELGLSEQEKAAGWILSCVRIARTDLVLEVEDLGDLSLMPVKTLACRIHSLTKLNSDVLHVILRLPPNSHFEFHPGQYIEVIAAGELRRSYSLANASAAENLLELHIRAVSDGAMSYYWFEKAQPNDLLWLNGPLGTFILRKLAGLDLVFLATGTGIAPVKAMLEALTRFPEPVAARSITVYWGGRSKEDLYWDIAAIAQWVRYIPVLSRPDSTWSGATGYVQNVFLAEPSELEKAVVYACGSAAMINQAQELLLKNGLPERQFYSDAFVCSAVEANEEA